MFFVSQHFEPAVQAFLSFVTLLISYSVQKNINVFYYMSSITLKIGTYRWTAGNTTSKLKTSFNLCLSQKWLSNILSDGDWFHTWSNSLVVKILDSLSRGPVFKTTGWLQRWCKTVILLRSIKWVPGISRF